MTAAATAEQHAIRDGNIIDGKQYATHLRSKITQQVAALKQRYGMTPGLAVILVGEDPASRIYVHNKGQKTKEVGMNSFEFPMPAETTQKGLMARLNMLNNDPKIHGILVQLPLPDHIDEEEVINSIAPEKDVDGFHVENVGLLHTNQEGAFAPCTPTGCLMLIQDALGEDLSGKKAIVIGRSNIVGKPMAQLLLQQNCTVTIAHSRTANIEEECRQADIVVAAVGKAEMVKKDWIKPGAVVIDVGINRITLDDETTKLRGDVDFEGVKEVAGAITPVPGGVGPMTIACLLYNTLLAACMQRGLPIPEIVEQEETEAETTEEE